MATPQQTLDEKALPQTETGKSNRKGKTPKTAIKKTPLEASVKATEAQLKSKASTQALVTALLEKDTKVYSRYAGVAEKKTENILDYCASIQKAFDRLKGKAIKSLKFDPWKDFISQVKGKTYVSKYRAIANHKEGINDPQNLHCLPYSFSTLYILTSLKSVSKFSAACKSGKINPEMTREEADKLVGKKHSEPLFRYDQVVVNGSGEEAIQNLEKTIDTIKDEIKGATNLKSAKGAAAATPSSSITQPEDEDEDEEQEEIETPVIQDGRFFRFNLNRLSNSLYATATEERKAKLFLAQLKASTVMLPNIAGSQWVISLEPVAD